MDHGERERLHKAWRATTCELAEAGGWVPLTRAVPARPTLVITAWNPGSRLLPEEVNAARDRVLAAELAALGLEARRVRGSSPDRTWHEDGWATDHRNEAASLALVRAYGQLAGFVFDRGGRALLWADGTLDWLDAPL